MTITDAALAERKLSRVFAGSSMPSLTDLVLHVVGMRAEEQVGGVDAGRVVALVENLQVIGNRPDVNLIRDTMCLQASVLAPERSVPVGISAAIPFPTAIGVANSELRPEPFFNRPEANDVRAGAATRWNGDVPDDVRMALKGGATDGTDESDEGRLGVHFWSLLTGSGVPCLGLLPTTPGLSHASIIPHFMGIKAVC